MFNDELYTLFTGYATWTCVPDSGWKEQPNLTECSSSDIQRINKMVIICRMHMIRHYIKSDKALSKRLQSLALPGHAFSTFSSIISSQFKLFPTRVRQYYFFTVKQLIFSSDSF